MNGGTVYETSASALIRKNCSVVKVLPNRVLKWVELFLGITALTTLYLYRHAWDMAAEICLSQLPSLLRNPGAEFQVLLWYAVREVDAEEKVILIFYLTSGRFFGHSLLHLRFYSWWGNSAVGEELVWYTMNTSEVVVWYLKVVNSATENVKKKNWCGLLRILWSTIHWVFGVVAVAWCCLTPDIFACTVFLELKWLGNTHLQLFN